MIYKQDLVTWFLTIVSCYRTMVSIDLTKLLDKAAGKEKANMFTDVMNLLGGDWAKVG